MYPYCNGSKVIEDELSTLVLNIYLNEVKPKTTDDNKFTLFLHKCVKGTYRPRVKIT